MQMNNSLKIWNMTTGKFIECVSPLNRSVAVNGEFTYATKFHDGNLSSNTVIMGGRNPKLEVLDITEKRVLCGFPVMKSVLAIDSKDRYIAYGGLEPLLRIVNYI
ncbi:hypothetical protein RI129_006044 [Pyrocoelia pectoralis]|uniref:Uncharacterized protein n=1 Tax=Pyrocoelia pectoralis TaxID=417401 RepID=A0AAN7VJ81_9COLE